jgi:N-acetylglutamate synthase-like GNAT family acetyltransferase
MIFNLTYRKATIDDLTAIVKLLLDDELGVIRENPHITLDQCYIDAFQKIDIDPNHYLMIVENGEAIIGTCHLTLMPSLTFRGSTRMQIEAVRITKKYRSQKIGTWMIDKAIAYGKSKGATIIQ